MLFLAECIRIFTKWQAIPFKGKFYLLLLANKEFFLRKDALLLHESDPQDYL